MLFGQDLGRSHEGDLVSVLHGQEGRQKRDDRLAAADVPLQETIHRAARHQIVGDLLERPPLRSSQVERQRVAQAIADPIVDAQAGPPGPPLIWVARNDFSEPVVALMEATMSMAQRPSSS